MLIKSDYTENGVSKGEFRCAIGDKVFMFVKHDFGKTHTAFTIAAFDGDNVVLNNGEIVSRNVLTCDKF